MTTQQLHLFNALYLVILIVVAVLTRATVRRIAGALAGAAVGGVVVLGIIAFGEEVGWWHMAITREPYFLTLMWIDFALCGFIFLITWRIARRFGWRAARGSPPNHPLQLNGTAIPVLRRIVVAEAAPAVELNCSFFLAAGNVARYYQPVASLRAALGA